MKRTNILLNTDGADSSSEVDPILMNDQTNTSTSMPLLPADEYRLGVVKVETAQNSKKTGNVVKIQLKTLDPTNSVSGESIAPGFPVFHTISITPTADYPRSSIDRALKGFMESCGFDSGSFYPLERYEGKIVRAKVKIQPATAEWDESNKIARFLK